MPQKTPAKIKIRRGGEAREEKRQRGEERRGEERRRGEKEREERRGAGLLCDTSFCSLS